MVLTAFFVSAADTIYCVFLISRKLARCLARSLLKMTNDKWQMTNALNIANAFYPLNKYGTEYDDEVYKRNMVRMVAGNVCRSISQCMFSCGGARHLFR